MQRQCFGRRMVVLSALILVVAASEARAGLIINPIFDSSMNAQQEAAVNYVIGEYEHLYTNNITLNINFSMGQTGLGESESYFEDGFTYAQVKAALAAQALANPTDTIKQSVVASLPATNPAPSNNFAVTTAQAKALGLDTSYTGLDGYVIFSNAVTYTYDPNNRGVAGEYDFLGVAEHEISEVMGAMRSWATTSATARATRRTTCFASRPPAFAASPRMCRILRACTFRSIMGTRTW